MVEHEAIARLTRPRSGDSTEVAKARAWLATRPTCDFAGDTPAMMMLRLLRQIDLLGAELHRSLR